MRLGKGEIGMTDIALERVKAPAVNGDREARSTEASETVLAREDTLSGRLQVKGNGSVLGTFSGRIECEGELLIGADAHVEADIRGTRVTIAGFVRGNVVATTRLKIASTGRLEGDARVGALVVQEGGVHHGVIRVHPEGVPDEPEQVLTDASSHPGSADPKSLQNSVERVKKFWGEFF
jgi:cytoskeletal protein CcmA (bactofilin family)